MRRIFLTAITVLAGLCASDATALPDFSEPQAVDEPVFTAATSRATGHDVASLDGRRAVVWIRDYSSIMATRVGADGEVMDEQPRVLRVTSTVAQVRIAAHDSGYILVWEEGTNTRSMIYALPLDASLQPTDSPRALSAPNQQSALPDIAWNGSSFLVTWFVQTSSARDARATRIGTNGAALDNAPTTIWSGGLSTGPPAVASNGESFLVAWPDDHNAARILAARVSSGGSLIDTEPIEFSGADEQAVDPTVSSDGSNYLVAWRERMSDLDGIFAARVDAESGAVVDENPIEVSRADGDEREPMAVWDGDRYLVAWDRRAGPAALDSHAVMRHITADGAVPGEPAVVLSGNPTPELTGPRLSVDQTGVYATWRDARYRFADVLGSRLDQDLSRLDGDGRLVSAMPNVQSNAAVAATHEGFLLVWQDNRNPERSFDILGMRFDHTGARVDAEPFVICDAPGDQQDPAVASTGDNFLVVWSDGRGERPRLFGARVRSSDGAVSPESGGAMTLGSLPQEEPAVATDGDSYLVAWAEPVPGSRSDRSVFVKDLAGSFGASVTEGSSMIVARNESRYPNVAVAGQGNGYVVVWNRWTDTGNIIAGARVDATGVLVSDEPQRLVEGEGYAPELISNGRSQTLVWRSGVAPPFNVFVAELDRSTGSAPAKLGADGESDFGAAITFTGSEYVTLWMRPNEENDGGTVRGASLSAERSLIDDPAGQRLDAAVNPTVATTSGGMSLAAWSRKPSDLAQTPRLFVSSFGVDSDDDTIADPLDNCPNIPNRDQANSNATEPGDACEPARADDVGTDAGTDAQSDTSSSSDVDVWETGGDVEGGCSCSSSRGTPPWGGVMLWLVAMVVVRVRRMSG
jgi:MYXO-CTERM domain-containing protein